MGDASSAILMGACAGVAVVSLALGYLAELVIPVQKKPVEPPPPKPKTIEERVQLLETKSTPPAPPAPPAPPNPSLFAPSSRKIDFNPVQTTTPRVVG